MKTHDSVFKYFAALTLYDLQNNIVDRNEEVTQKLNSFPFIDYLRKEISVSSNKFEIVFSLLNSQNKFERALGISLTQPLIPENPKILSTLKDIFQNTLEDSEIKIGCIWRLLEVAPCPEDNLSYFKYIKDKFSLFKSMIPNWIANYDALDVAKKRIFDINTPSWKKWIYVLISFHSNNFDETQKLLLSIKSETEPDIFNAMELFVEDFFKN